MMKFEKKFLMLHFYRFPTNMLHFNKILIFVSTYLCCGLIIILSHSIITRLLHANSPGLTFLRAFWFCVTARLSLKTKLKSSKNTVTVSNNAHWGRSCQAISKKDIVWRFEIEKGWWDIDLNIEICNDEVFMRRWMHHLSHYHLSQRFVHNYSSIAHFVCQMTNVLIDWITNQYRIKYCVKGR